VIRHHRRRHADASIHVREALHQPQAHIEPVVPAPAAAPADDPADITAAIAGAGFVGILQPIRERNAVVTADANLRIGPRHRRGDHLGGESNRRHGAVDSLRRETAPTPISGAISQTKPQASASSSVRP
jgi:hypothetical protein